LRTRKAQPSDLDNVRVFLHQRLTQRDPVLFIAEAYGRAVGFPHLYPSFSSLSMARIFILNNLFVVPEARRPHCRGDPALPFHRDHQHRRSGALCLGRLAA
jgi:hypothetical protein